MIPRPRIISLLLITAVFAVSGSAQKQKPEGPRAVAVLEWTGRKLRLVPVSLLIDGKFYDASLYRANPIPLALDQGNIYQVQSEGEGIGDFTVTLAGETPNGSWVGEGNYLSDVDKKKAAERKAKAAADAAAATEAERNRNPAEDRPVLRRGKADSSPTTTPPPPTNAPPPKGSAEPVQQRQPPQTETSSDPNRPILRRGKETTEQAQKLGNENTKSMPLKEPPAGLKKLQVAVSDASEKEPRPYKWSWANPEEQSKIRQQIEKIALDEAAKYATKTNGPKPGQLEDVEVHAFDLAYNNSPDVILSAKVIPAVEAPPRKGAKQSALPEVPTGFEYYVTVVARQDIYALLNKNFAAVTDNRHLDVFPRLQVVDAVDADGTGGGDLLFRATTDTGNAYLLYKVYGSRLDEIVRVPDPKLIP